MEIVALPETDGGFEISVTFTMGGLDKSDFFSAYFASSSDALASASSNASERLFDRNGRQDIPEFFKCGRN